MQLPSLSRWKHVIYFFLHPPFRASGCIFITGDTMRLLPSHYAAVQRRIKTGNLFATQSLYMCFSCVVLKFVCFYPLKQDKKTIKQEHLSNHRSESTSTEPFNHSAHAGFITFLLHFSFQTKTDMFESSWRFGKLQHHLRDTFS